MNKVIFQLGLLGFFVSGVFYSIQGTDLLSTVARAFIIFIGVIVLAALFFIAGSFFNTPKQTENDQPGHDAGPGRRDPVTAPKQPNVVIPQAK
jgi:hypothetical protein